MNDLTKKVLDLFNENNINKNDMLNTLTLIYKELEINLWENFQISPIMFYGLKDLTWYNLEHLPNGGEEKGLSNMRYLGTKFPHFIYCCNNTNIIESVEISSLLQELDNIIVNWSKDWKFVTLYTKSMEGWKGGDEPSKLIIYDTRTESPSKYGYNVKYNSILDAHGYAIKKADTDTVLCALDESIGEYANGQILYNNLIQFRETCRRALRNNRDVKIDLV